MKSKTLRLAALALLAVPVFANDAFGFGFGLIHCYPRHHSLIICRPYNAFTPICYGNMVCDGCCPSPCCGPIQRSCMPAPMVPDCCGPTCGSFAAAPQIIMAPGAQMAPGQVPAPMPPGSPNFTAPMPTPNGPALNQTSMRFLPQGMMSVQPVGYHPGYGYMPAYQQYAQPQYAQPQYSYPQYPQYPQYSYPVLPYQSMPMPYQAVPAYWYGR